MADINKLEGILKSAGTELSNLKKEKKLTAEESKRVDKALKRFGITIKKNTKSVRDYTKAAKQMEKSASDAIGVFGKLTSVVGVGGLTFAFDKVAQATAKYQMQLYGSIRAGNLFGRAQGPAALPSRRSGPV